MFEADAELIREIDHLAPKLMALSRELFLHPELGNEEYYAQERITEFMRQSDWAIQKGIGGLSTSFVASWGSSFGPAVGFMAEYDALPGLGHACGHNLISAASVGAAIALSKVLQKGKGMIKVFGTPAEETSGGKISLLNCGVFENLDAVMMFHPGIYNALNLKSLALEALEITFRGPGGHAITSSTSKGDTLEAILQFFYRIGNWRNCLSPSSQIHGIIKEGGLIPNVRPIMTVGRFYLRAPEEAELSLMIDCFISYAKEVADKTGTDVTVAPYENRYKPFISNQTMVGILARSLRKLKIGCSGKCYQGMGSMDMGNVSYHIPAVHPYLTLEGAPSMLHTAEFARAAGGDWGDRLLILGAKTLALTAYQVMTREKLRKRIWAEHINKVHNTGGVLTPSAI